MSGSRLPSFIKPLVVDPDAANVPRPFEPEYTDEEIEAYKKYRETLPTSEDEVDEEDEDDEDEDEDDDFFARGKTAQPDEPPAPIPADELHTATLYRNKLAVRDGMQISWKRLLHLFQHPVIEDWLDDAAIADIGKDQLPYVALHRKVEHRATAFMRGACGWLLDWDKSPKDEALAEAHAAGCFAIFPSTRHFTSTSAFKIRGIVRASRWVTQAEHDHILHNYLQPLAPHIDALSMVSGIYVPAVGPRFRKQWWTKIDEGLVLDVDAVLAKIGPPAPPKPRAVEVAEADDAPIERFEHARRVIGRMGPPPEDDRYAACRDVAWAVKGAGLTPEQGWPLFCEWAGSRADELGDRYFNASKYSDQIVFGGDLPQPRKIPSPEIFKGLNVETCIVHNRQEHEQAYDCDALITDLGPMGSGKTFQSARIRHRAGGTCLSVNPGKKLAAANATRFDVPLYLESDDNINGATTVHTTPRYGVRQYDVYSCDEMPQLMSILGDRSFGASAIRLCREMIANLKIAKHAHVLGAGLRDEQIAWIAKATGRAVRLVRHERTDAMLHRDVKYLTSAEALSFARDAIKDLDPSSPTFKLQPIGFTTKSELRAFAKWLRKRYPDLQTVILDGDAKSAVMRDPDAHVRDAHVVLFTSAIARGLDIHVPAEGAIIIHNYRNVAMDDVVQMIARWREGDVEAVIGTPNWHRGTLVTDEDAIRKEILDRAEHGDMISHVVSTVHGKRLDDELFMELAVMQMRIARENMNEETPQQAVEAAGWTFSYGAYSSPQMSLAVEKQEVEEERIDRVDAVALPTDGEAEMMRRKYESEPDERDRLEKHRIHTFFDYCSRRLIKLDKAARYVSKIKRLTHARLIEVAPELVALLDDEEREHHAVHAHAYTMQAHTIAACVRAVLGVAVGDDAPELARMDLGARALAWVNVNRRAAALHIGGRMPTDARTGALWFMALLRSMGARSKRVGKTSKGHTPRVRITWPPDVDWRPYAIRLSNAWKARSLPAASSARPFARCEVSASRLSRAYDRENSDSGLQGLTFSN